METDDEDLDTHICLACQLPIIGLENYVFHKKHECSAKKHKRPSGLSQVASQDITQGHTLTGTQQTHLTDGHANTLQSMGEPLGGMQLGSEQLVGQLSPAVCQAMSLLTKSPSNTTTTRRRNTPARFSVVDPNMVLDTMSLPVHTTEHSIVTSVAHDTLPISTLSDNLTSSTPSIMDFLSTLELQCRPHTSPEKLEQGTTDDNVSLEPRVPDGLKLANLLNDLTFDSDSEGFDMPSDAEDLLNFTEDDYRELGVTGMPGGKGKGHGEGKGHGKGKTKGKVEYLHPGKNKKVGLPGKWRPGERIGGKLLSSGRWSSIGKRHYEEMSSDEETTEPIPPPEGSTDAGVIAEDSSIIQSQPDMVPTLEAAPGFSDNLNTGENSAITVESIDNMEATAVNVLLQIKSEVRDSIPDHTYDGSEAPIEGADHTYDMTVGDKGTVSLLRCEPCNRLFRNGLALHSHMRSAQHKAMSAGLPIVEQYEKSDRPFRAECSGCQRLFNNKYNYARHLVSALHLKRSKSTLLHLDPAFQRLLLPLKLFQCRICQFYCNTQSDLLEHISTEEHNGKLDNLIGPMTCIRCKYISRSPRDLYKHFTSKEHDKTVAESDRPCVLKEVRHNLPCVHCGKTFHSATKLKQHCTVQHPIKQEKCKGMERQTHCQICSKTFSSHCNWLQHHRRKHMESGDQFRCEVCHTKGFADQSYLESHYRSRKHLDTVLKASAVSETLDNSLNTDESSQLGSPRGRGRPPGSKNKNKHPHKIDGSRLYKCKECDFSTAVYTELRPHYIDIHSKNVMYDFMCDVCGVGFDVEIKLIKHQESRRHKNMENEAEAAGHKAIICSTCAHKFYSQDRYSLHMLTHKAAERTSEQDKKISHKLRGVPEKFHNFVKKVPSGHIKDMQCPECKEWCKSNNIVPHIRGKHGDRHNMPYKCTFCPKTFPSNASLYRHHKAHLGMRSFICKICTKGYRCKADLETHEWNVHRKELDVVPKLQCSFCGEQFMQRTRLTIHMKKKHEKERQFPCTWPGCHLQFIFQSEFLTHFRVHTRERPYLCDLCGFATKTKVQLRRHERIHTGESNHKCKYCTYSATHSWGLRRHMRIHSGVKPYKCPHCNYTCNCHTNLRHHIITSKRHPGMCLYHCKHCAFATNKGHEFQQHCIFMHSIQKELVENVAEYCEVYFPQEDARDVLEGCQVLPVVERKPRTKKKPLQNLPKQQSDLLNQVEPSESVTQKTENNSYIQQHNVDSNSGNTIYMFHPESKPDIGKAESEKIQHQEQIETIAAACDIKMQMDHRSPYVPQEVVQQEVIHEVIHHEVINGHNVQGVVNNAVSSHGDTHHSMQLTPEISHLIAPHIEALEQGTVVELHMDEDYTVPTQRQGHALQMVGSDNKPIQFYYM